MQRSGTALVGDIHPKSSTQRLNRSLPQADLDTYVDGASASAVLGMSPAFVTRALGRRGTAKTLTIAEVLDLLDVDGFQETFVPRSKIPSYLLSLDDQGAGSQLRTDDPDGCTIVRGNARDLIPQLTPASVQCVVTSSPYWGMRVYENTRPVMWADEEHCAYGFEQTPEGFIRHTVEILHLLKPAVTATGSLWWNVMDTYNTRTPIRGNARERLNEMGNVPDSRRGWTEHDACRHSAGHMFLSDAEQCSIPARIAERASRVGYRLKSYITWRKHSSTPEPVRSRATRQAECILHLGVGATPPFFAKAAWQKLNLELGGPHPLLESDKRITDVWSLPTSLGKNGHGAEFPLALPGRCIALSTKEGDVVLDPFIGSGTTALAAVRLGRRCIGFDISASYVELANERVAAEQQKRRDAAREQIRKEAQLNLESAPPRVPSRLVDGAHKNAVQSTARSTAASALVTAMAPSDV